MFRNRRRAYTTAEILIASFLSLALGAIVSVTLVSTSRVTGDTVTDTRLQQEGRALTEVLGQFLRSAKPLGVCLDERTSQNGDCKVVKEEDHPFLTASPASSSTLTFFSYTNAASENGGFAEGYAPDLVKITVVPVGQNCTGDGCFELRVTLRCNANVLDGAVCASPSGSTDALEYTNPGAAQLLAARQALQSRVVYVSNPNPFTYLDIDGRELCTQPSGTAGTACTAAELASIAVVKVDATAVDLDAPQPQSLLIPLPSRGFRG